jgi:hypothetical protein
MAVPICLFQDGAEHDALTAAVAGGSVAIGGAVSIASTTAYLHGAGTGGARCFLIPATAGSFVQFNGWGNTGRDCCWYWYTVNQGTGGDLHAVWFDGATAHLTLIWALDGSLELRRGTSTGTVVASAVAGTLPRSTGLGHWMRATVTIADAGGTFTLYAGGASILTFTGDTRNGALAQWNSVRFNTPQTISGSVAIDDFCVFDATLAPTGEYFQASPDPNSDIATTLTRSAGATNYGTIDERPHDAADYNALTPAVATNGDTYGHAGTTGLGFTPAAVISVMVGAVFKRDGVITGAKMRLKSGATTYKSGSTLAGGAAGTSVFRYTIWNTDPATAADWTEAGFNAAGHGAEGA